MYALIIPIAPHSTHTYLYTPPIRLPRIFLCMYGSCAATPASSQSATRPFFDSVQTHLAALAGLWGWVALGVFLGPLVSIISSFSSRLVSLLF